MRQLSMVTVRTTVTSILEISHCNPMILAEQERL